MGLTKFQAFRLVILPQAMQVALPPLVNDAIAASFRFVEWYCAALVYYLVIVSFFMAVQAIVARKL